MLLRTKSCCSLTLKGITLPFNLWVIFTATHLENRTFCTPGCYLSNVSSNLAGQENSYGLNRVMLPGPAWPGVVFRPRAGR